MSEAKANIKKLFDRLSIHPDNATSAREELAAIIIKELRERTPYYVSCTFEKGFNVLAYNVPDDLTIHTVSTVNKVLKNLGIDWLCIVAVYNPHETRAIMSPAHDNEVGK